MHAAFKAEKTTIYNLLAEFANWQLKVPDYQRGYSWEMEHFGAFWRDITTFARKKKEGDEQVYFLGPIVLMNAPASDELYWLVDGQQRVVTSVILLATMRDLAEALEDDSGEAAAFADQIHERYLASEGIRGGEKWSIRLGDLDQSYFERHVQRRDRSAGLIPRNPSNGLIKRARHYLEQQLHKSLQTKSKPLDYLHTLMRVLTHHVVMLAVFVDNERDAMTVFERTNVRGKPLAEADLVRNRLMVEAGTKQGRKEVRKQWTRMEELLGTDAKMSRFLQHMWESRHGSLAGTKLYDAIDLALDESDTTAEDFAADCVEDCHNYAEFLKQHSKHIHHDGVRAARAAHATLGVKAALPLLLASQRRFGKTPDFSVVVRATEALIVRHRVLAGRKGAALRRCFLEAALAINEAPSKEWARTICLKVLKKENPTDQEVIAAVRGKMKLPKRTALHLLREIEDFHGQLDSHRATATLEHIFPVRASTKDWPRAAALKPYLSHLGNLALLTKSDNVKASNRAYGHKKKRVYADATLRTTREILEYRQWGLSPLLRRAEALARIAVKRWRI